MRSYAEKDLKIKKLKQQYLDEESQHLTFHPTINKKRPRTPGPMTGVMLKTRSQAVRKSQKVLNCHGAMLHSKAAEKVNKMDILRRKRVENEMKECLFHPMINPKSRVMDYLRMSPTREISPETNENDTEY